MVKAIEAVKIIKDSDGNEAIYEPNTDLTAVATGVLVETVVAKDDTTGAEITIEAGLPTTIVSGTIPTVSSSTILSSAPSDIVVVWSEDMKGTKDIINALNIIVDGAAAVNPTNAVFKNKLMTLTMSAPATAGQVITWAYDDQNPTERLETVLGNIEADNQTYAVNNNAN